MMKTKFLLSLLYPVILTILIAVVLTSFEFRFLLASFKINSSGHKVPIISLIPDIETQSPLTKTARVYLEYKIFEDPGYTLSFFIKTGSRSQKETRLFYSADKRLGSIYWNISIVDGKVETARLEHILPAITDKRVNDNRWHHVFVATNRKEVRIYLDDELDKSAPVYKLHLPDKWFVIDVDQEIVGDDQIYLRDFIFINKNLSPKEFEVYHYYFLGNKTPLYRLILIHFIVNLLIIISFYGFLVFIIKSNYENQNFFPIINNISSKLSLCLLATIFFWTSYGYQISLFCFFLFFYCLLQDYKNIFPDYLRTFIITPISFLLNCSKLLRKLKIKKLFKYSTSQKPEIYFCLFLFLGLLFSLNRFLFTNNRFL